MTVSIINYNLENGFSNEWKTIKFTDETITDLKWNEDSGLLFATTQSGIIWVSSDKGETWHKQGEIIEKIHKDYQQQRADVDRDYVRKKQDIYQEFEEKLRQCRTL